MNDDDPERRQRPGDIVAYRLSEIEKRLDAQAKAQATGFSEVARQIAGLTFVRSDTYAADQRTAAEIHATLRKDIEEVKADVSAGFGRMDRRVNWSHATIGVALLGAVVAGIARLAGVS